ncbi:ArnT family glycosyltransferase [Planctomicrobium sp. SH527]|uniref:ArnT family glycosyltransferase n=1 Tax=Planctomicrobium sp. SH527 TaxID=3448123 RepID=UPI003F5C43B3
MNTNQPTESVQPAPDAQQLNQSKRSPLAIVLVLAGIVLLVLFARLRLLELPLERDEGEYAYGAQLLLHGGRLYHDLHTMKWPGMYAAYAILFTIGGENITTIHLGLLLVNLVSAIAVYLITRQFTGRNESLVASACFLVLSVLPVMHGVIANAEHFAMMFPLLGIWCLIHSLRGGQLAGVFIAGALFGLGPVMKQHAHAFVILGGMMTLLTPWPSTVRRGLANVSNAVIFSAGVALVWGAMCLAIWKLGVWDQFVTWTVIYPKDYTRQIPITVAPSNFLHTFLPILTYSWPLFLLAMTGLISVLRRGDTEQRCWGIALVVTGLLAISPGFYFREHYFLLLIPTVAILAAFGVRAIADHFQQRLGKVDDRPVAFLCGAALLLPLIMQAGLLFTQPLRVVSRTLYGANPFVESPEIGKFLRERMHKDDLMTIFGSEPQLCFYSQRRLATGDIYMYPMTEIHPLAKPMQTEMIQNVGQAEPRFAIYVSTPTAWLLRPQSEQQLINFIPSFLKNYRMVGLVQTKSFEETDYNFAPPGEYLRGYAASPPVDSHYVAIYCRKDALE